MLPARIGFEPGHDRTELAGQQHSSFLPRRLPGRTCYLSGRGHPDVTGLTIVAADVSDAEAASCAETRAAAAQHSSAAVRKASEPAPATLLPVTAGCRKPRPQPPTRHSELAGDNASRNCCANGGMAS